MEQFINKYDFLIVIIVLSLTMFVWVRSKIQSLSPETIQIQTDALELLKGGDDYEALIHEYVETKNFSLTGQIYWGHKANGDTTLTFFINHHVYRFVKSDHEWRIIR